jgi:hypothetical protein
MAVKACNWKFHEKLFKHISPEVLFVSGTVLYGDVYHKFCRQKSLSQSA